MLLISPRQWTCPSSVVVNGPGEAAQTVLGLTGGGNGRHKVYMGGRPDHNVSDEEMVDHFVDLIEKEAEKIEAALAS